MVSKIALGTVQFGLPYGINNKTGQVSQEQACKILGFAKSKGIDTLDTAFSYGTSEETIGKCGERSFSVVSKLPIIQEKHQVGAFCKKSLARLNRSHIYGYLVHSYQNYIDHPYLYNELLSLKEKGLVQKTGFSLYYPEELKALIESKTKIDIIQVPCNILNQDFVPLFKKANELGIEIHIRSVFMQGLLLMPLERINQFFNPILKVIKELDDLSIKTHKSKQELCLAYALQLPFVNRIVLGVDSLSHLENNLSVVESAENFNRENEIVWSEFSVKDDQFTNPSNWKLNG